MTISKILRVRLHNACRNILLTCSGVILLLSLLIPLAIASPRNSQAISSEVGSVSKAVALTRFDNAIVDKTTEEKSNHSIQDLVQELKDLEKDYLEELKDRRSSYGLFATGEFDNDIHNAETQYRVGLRWKLFNDGYFESVREDAKKILQTQLEFYQLRRDMIERKLEEDLYRLFTFENMVNINHYRTKRAGLESLLSKRKDQLRHGYTTEIDVFDIERQLEKCKNSLEFYRNSHYAAIPEAEFSLLNQWEHIHLKPVTELVEQTEYNSFDLKIQDNFIQRSEFFPGWSQNLTINLDAEQKKEYYGTDRSIIGIKMELPLTFDSDRSSLIETQKRIYRYQKRAISHRLFQKIDKLKAFFDFQQHRLLSLQEDIELILLKMNKAAAKEAHIVQQLDTDPTRSLDLLSINMFDARYEALKTRLKIYEIVLKVTAITQTTDINSLFEFD